LQYTKYSCGKMASSGEKSLAVGHISGFQIDPKLFIFMGMEMKIRLYPCKTIFKHTHSTPNALNTASSALL
jgi:hypothetical protein